MEVNEGSGDAVVLDEGGPESNNWTSHSRAKAEAALTAAQKAQEEARIARITAKEFSPSFQHRENGLEYQRPKRQRSSDDIEVISTGTPVQQESPELYRKGTTPGDSPLQSFPASPTATPPPAPASRNKVAHFSRQRRTGSPTTFSWTSHHRAGNPGPGSSKLLELDEEKLSSYEMEMKPLLRMDSYAQEVHPPKGRYSKGGAEDRGFGAPRLRSTAQNKEHARPASCAEPAVQRLESLRLGDRAEPRLLRWDLTFSPPQRSSPVALESDEENGDELKAGTGSAPILVAMVILLNIGVAILCLIHTLELVGSQDRNVVETQWLDNS
ncbi:Junctophilin-3, partial [Eschrichtius robustus]|nr:Junctophilin-3 [Eschrichtius robustus]